MKLKKVLLLLTTTLLLSGCDFLDKLVSQLPTPPSHESSSSVSTNSSSHSSSNSSSNSLISNSTNSSNNISSSTTGSNISSNTNKPIDSSSDITDDDSIYEKDAYKTINLKAPDFSTRRISSKEDVVFEDLFNLGNKVSIKIDIKDEELEKIQRDYETGYKSEIYHIADKVEISLTNYGNTYTWEFDQVGIRQKGNTSRKDVFRDGKIDGLNHFKLSFDETFDNVEKYGNEAIDWTNKEADRVLREERDFLGLPGIDIKWNKNYDSTHIKEIYASYLYDAAGLMSNSIGLTEMVINQKDKNRSYDFGLCTLFEPTNKAFIKDELRRGPYVNTGTWDEEKAGTYGVPGAKYGDYYKASWGIGEGGTNNGADLSKQSTEGKKVGIGNISGSYIPAYERKTNTKDVYNDGLLKNLTNAISNKSYEEIEKLMDLEYFAITEACNYYIGNPDDLRNNNNNYTIYFRRTDGKAIIIPIDNDRCFGITKDWDPTGNGMSEKSVFSTNPAARDRMNDLHLKTILSSSSNDSKAIYLNYVKALKASSWTNYDTFKELYDKAYATYGNSSTETSFGGGFEFNVGGANGNWGFRDYIEKKKTKVDLNQVLSSSGSNENPGSSNNNSSSSQDSSSQDREGYYGQVYLIGSFCSWNQGNRDYPFEYKGNGEYTITFKVGRVDDNRISWKIYDGYNFNSINWTVVDDKLALDGGNYSSAKIDNVNRGDEITITVNTITKEVNIKVGE